ncbi:hypothetical protein IGI04_038942 [Brassica rapa subsp. trilocularis]|uniref:Peptidase M16 N-terminal domain-containing protein n=1 Tax=Brassica rapa subsp. trilocularis TaxID=1813537 RepID=A0ABQ7LLQ1_BRACM|nr:hypothetical protein IGI04_038942 [Brassica rapa subsp. trilocularis]
MDEDDGEEEEDSDGSYEGDDEEGDDMDEDEMKEKGEQQTKKAAASFLDPPEAQGLAHFLEHMLFMGSNSCVNESMTATRNEAVNISRIFKNSLTTEPLPVKSRHREQITCFPLSAKLVRDVNVKNKSETNSVVELYYQIEPEEAQSTKMKAMLDLFHEIIEEPLFNQLRTKEQLGYVVECGPRFTYRVHGFCFCVQSSKYGPVHLFGRIDNFIKDIEGLLIRLNNSMKSPLEIIEAVHVCLLPQRSRRAKKHREKKDVISWYKTYFRESSPKCRRLAVREWRCDTNMKETQTDLKSVQQVIADAVAFKSTSQFYPSLCY